MPPQRRQARHACRATIFPSVIADRFDHLPVSLCAHRFIVIEPRTEALLKAPFTPARATYAMSPPILFFPSFRRYSSPPRMGCRFVRHAIARHAKGVPRRASYYSPAHHRRQWRTLPRVTPFALPRLQGQRHARLLVLLLSRMLACFTPMRYAQ